MFLASWHVSLLLFLLCFIESTQLITMLCSSVAAWEGTDTRSSFCFCTGKTRSHHHRDVYLCNCLPPNCNFFLPFQEMMLSIWSTHISMRITRWTMWTSLQGSPTFSTSSLTTRVSFDGLLQNRTPWFVCVDFFFFVAFVSPCPHSAIVSAPVCGARVSHAYV